MAEEKRKILCSFGQYEGKELDWFILDREEDRLFLLSRDAVAQRATGGKYVRGMDDEVYVTQCWQESGIRAWLNGAFLKEAFREEERKKISATDVRCADLLQQEGGWKVMKDHHDTQDRLFLLSEKEVGRLFPEYGKERIPGGWWLRDYYNGAGWEDDHIAVIEEDGRLRRGMPGAARSVRPAMWIRCPSEVIREHAEQREKQLLAEKDRLSAERKKTEAGIPAAELEKLRRLKKEWSDAASELRKKQETVNKSHSSLYSEVREAEKKYESISGILFLHKKAAKSALEKVKQRDEEVRAHWEAAVRARDEASNAEKAAKQALEKCKAYKTDVRMDELDEKIRELDEEMSRIR